MTQQFIIRTSTDAALSLEGFEHLQSAEGPTERFNPHCYETKFFIADTEDKADIVTELENQLDGVEWATVDYRHTTSEYSDPTYRDDPEYYHDSHDLRTPASIEYVDGFTIRIEWHGGEETREIDPVGDGYRRTDEITVEDGLKLGSVTVKEPIDRIPRSGITVRDYPPESPASETVVKIGTEPESEPVHKRILNVETGIGADGPVVRGVAKRIDEHEDRIDALETE